MKKILLYVFVFLFLITPLNALELGSNSEGYERTESNNYGVNKEWKNDRDNLNSILKTPYVDASNKIYDFADILDEEDESELSILINGFINETGLDFVFVSIDIPYADDSDNEEYANDFYDYNDFGIDNEYYGGIILLRNNYEEDPYYIASVIGEAQLYCDEERLDYLLDEIYDYFKSKEYSAGISSFLHNFKNYYDNGTINDDYYIDEYGSLNKNERFNAPYLLSIFSGFIVSLLTMLGLVKKNKMVKKSSNANDYLIKSSVEYMNKSDNLISTITTHHRINTNIESGGHGGSSHSGFGSSGGGHISGGRHG